MEISLPMIDSILFPKEQAQWTRLGDYHDIAQLHNKFWRDGNFGNQLLKVHEDKGPEEGKDDACDSDCHFLDLGIPFRSFGFATSTSDCSNIAMTILKPTAMRHCLPH